jgi:two-component system chemotaxis sensor kinase CheA
VAQVEPLAQRDDLLVIVFSIENHEFGLLAIPPVDTVDVAVKLDRETLRQTGIKGSAIIEDRTTLIVDIYEFIRTLRPEWFEQNLPDVYMEEDYRSAAANTGSKILYAEDSSFFRSTVHRMLEEEGYAVIDAEDGLQAWELLEANANDISMVLTDIEMPNLDGLGLAQKIRGDARFQNIPIIALTTLASEQDVSKGKKIGITDYQVKLDKDKLIASIQTMMASSVR